MKSLNEPIAFNEVSYTVALLHKVLEVAGSPVSKDEVRQRKAGEDTRVKVRALQARMNIPIDDSTLLDQQTIEALEENLTKRGLTAVSRSFTVAGTARMQNGSVKKQQHLLAFDLDLRGVATYRNLKTISKLERNGGFEFLGQSTTDSLGNYEITFYDWQYRRAERKKADVVVYAVQEGKDGMLIVGRSRLINSEDYSEKNFVRGLDIVIAKTDSRTEYAQLMATLIPFLDESGISLAEISTSSDQLAFTAAELDLDRGHLEIACGAELLVQRRKRRLSHELLYGIGRQFIRLDWRVLYQTHEDELRRAITKSIEARVIDVFEEKEIRAFLKTIHEYAIGELLDHEKISGSLGSMLSNALPEKSQRISFLNAVASFKSNRFEEFWDKHLPSQKEFRENPQLVSDVLLTQQLTLLTGNHQALVNELQVNRKIGSIDTLLGLEKRDWLEILRKTGVPDGIEGRTDEEKRERYLDSVQNLLNAAFPTRVIAGMIDRMQLPVEKTRVLKSISTFLTRNKHFDFAGSRIHDFKKEIKEVAGDDYDEVRAELMKIQRVYQVSTSPDAMRVLIENNLHSAYAIANIPRKSFVKTYGIALGGEAIAFAVHGRASHISSRAEMVAMHIMEYSHGAKPRCAMGESEFDAALTTIQKHLPNPSPSYAQLFGAPDICECEHCRSVYSAAAYLVELLRFLWRCEPNSDGKTPFDLLGERRPDLLHLPLTCENANTIIPYIDLANEVMEHYTANDSLTAFKGFDTGDATAGELRANPQSFNIAAYRLLANRNPNRKAVYPFALPYHQPLDVIRTYSDHLKASRYQVMKSMNPNPNATAANAIAAESLRLSEEEYTVLTGVDFEGTADATPLHEYFGYAVSGDIEKMSEVQEFLHRSGVAYTDLVELVKTKFINPHRSTLDFLERLFSRASIPASTIYERLVQIEAGTLDPANDAEIMAALNGYNAAQGGNITASEFSQWVSTHLREFRRVITLYEPDSKCDLETTELRNIESIYTSSATSGISHTDWLRIHHFIRLWRKLGWTIHETDLILAAVSEDDITAGTITKLEWVSLLKSAASLDPSRLAVCWSGIDIMGKNSLYRKLFLSKAVKQSDTAFEADAWGNYLQDGSEPLGDHQSAMLAAFRMREEDLASILGAAKVIDNGNPRPIDIETDGLNLGNLSTIYRYVILAKALKMRIPDLCRLITLFDISPFSTWDIQQQEFTGISPSNTFEFYQLADSVRKSGFNPVVLEYILKGTLSPESKIGLDKNRVLSVAKAVRDAFCAFEQSHPETPPSPLTPQVLSAKLSLTFQHEAVNRLMGIMDGTASFQTITDKNLDIVIPDALSRSFFYVKASGRLTCTGVMSDADKAALQGLANANAHFKQAVDRLYSAPEEFIDASLGGIIGDLSEANAKLLNHPAQAPASTLEEKLSYVYVHFIPILKKKLRRDAVTQHIAALICLSEAATSLLIAKDIDSLIADLSKGGFSACYFSDCTWATPVLPRTDETVDFAWGAGSPDPIVPAGNFSARWESYFAPPASGDYTLRVDVADPDELFKLYLDESLILTKTGADPATSWEVPTALNAAQMYLVKLEYAEISNNASVRLQWMTNTTAPEVIPASVTYPAAVLDSFDALATLYHRAAKFISGFSLSETELNHLIAFEADFGNINFKNPTAEHWQRIRDYTRLRNAVPQAQAMLTDVFAAAKAQGPPPALGNLKSLLCQASAWDNANVDFLVDTHFGYSVADFKNEIALNRVREVMQIVSKTGLSAETIAFWGAAETDFDVLNTTAQLIKNTVKAKYEEKDWLDLAGNLSDRIRKSQQQALIGYLLTRPAIQDWGAKDADGLFEYFLIDVQMGSCMETSRIVQAHASTQMFINRCLLNLESETSSGSEKGVSPEAIDKERWEWMKNYRVWEANRKVFLYPEDWLEPEWRNDRSEFFRELESYLVQNDITERTVEQGFRRYLASLNEIANLDVCGMFEEKEDGKLKFLHVFARTHTAPYKFYYRRWNEYGKWSAWEKVQVDIRCIEEGENSGVHLMPVVWKKRLILFWPEFFSLQKTPNNSTRSMEQVGTTQNISSLEPKETWEIRLAWSEYVDGKWTPKQLTKECASIDPEGNEKKAYTFVLLMDTSTQGLAISIKCPYNCSGCNGLGQAFEIIDLDSKVNLLSSDAFAGYSFTPSEYNNHFMKHARLSPLFLKGKTYLRNTVNHKLLYSPQIRDFQDSLEHPFFYHDDYRTYFVRPVDIPLLWALKEPKFHIPFLPGLETPIPLMLSSIVPGSDTPAGMPMPETRDVLTAYDCPGGSSRKPLTLPSMLLSNASPQPMAKSPVSAPTESYAMGMSNITEPFGGVKAVKYKQGMAWGKLKFNKSLEFHTFYHPFASEYVTNLNQVGLSRGSKGEAFPPGLMESDTTICSDEGARFEKAYDPNFVHGDVRTPADFARRTYYKENVCFDPFGANSLYNWELFFHAPLYIATRLSKNGKYEEAMKWFHYIFDPTTDTRPSAGESETSRYWKVLPFKTTPIESLEQWFRTLLPNTNPNTENAIIGEWRDNPFDPHLIAANRPLAYMKHVVIKYVENLIAWGDSLFREFQRESVNQALQIYVIANHILGPRPQFVPKRGEIKAESYESLKNKWDDFSNALVAMENIFPYSSEAIVSGSSTGSSLLGIGSALYFCIPASEKLLGYWDKVADRLIKIRHCQDIDGVERKLALFAPPIEPGALIQAASQGLSLGSILADLSSPPPIYRFTHLLQKANEFCTEVKALGAGLLAALEKKDSEELGRLRASHETQMLELVTAVKERQLLDAKVHKENLEKARATASFRLQHYIDLLGNDAVAVPSAPSIASDLTAESQLPADTNIVPVETDVDQSLVDKDESGVRMIPKEKEDLDKARDSMISQQFASGAEGLAGILHLLPTFDADGKPLGVGGGISYGGPNIGAAASGLAKVPAIVASVYSHQAAQAAKTAGFIRREQEWTLQANLAAKEIIQLDKQITSADIRIQVAQKELENHKQQIENSKQVELFLKGKFSNQELYQWMKEQLFAVYKQSYNLAFDMAKKAEKAYKNETGTELANFIQYGYWDNSKQGLAAGEKLQLALRQMEKSYLEDNRRELELTKSISLARLNPLALIELRETGRCFLSFPEELFDLDFRGHYFRRIKSVQLSIPCVAGPYTSVSCTLRLLNNSVRINTAMNSEGHYEHENDEGLWIDDNRFRTSHTPVTSVATSSAQRDSGTFEFNFRDERYLPFELAGVISDWQLELSTEKELRPFDYTTISDVILHLNYTARESGGVFKNEATTYLKNLLLNAAERTEQPLMQMFSMRQEFPTEWHRFLHPGVAGSEQVLHFTLGKERFPFFVRNRGVVVMKIEIFARCCQSDEYKMVLSYTKSDGVDGESVVSSEIIAPQSSTYGGLNKATIGVNDAGLNLMEVDITKEMTLKLKRSSAQDYHSLLKNPEEVKDIFIVLHYKLE